MEVLMKKLFVLLILMSSILLGNNLLNDEDVKTYVTNYVNTCKSGDVNKSAAFLVYQGEDTKRNLQSFLNVNIPDELRKADRLLKRINALLKLSESFEVSIENKSKPDNLDLYDVSVSFISKGNTIKINISVIKLANSFGILEVK
jgi:hypothetical protein